MEINPPLFLNRITVDPSSCRRVVEAVAVVVETCFGFSWFGAEGVGEVEGIVVVGNVAEGIVVEAGLHGAGVVDVGGDVAISIVEGLMGGGSRG